MNKLQELHDAVKIHPFRENFEVQYAKSYQKLLLEFRTNFYDIVKQTKYERGGTHMYHDFTWAILNFCWQRSNGEWVHRSEAIEHIELCISSIHKFIDTGKFEEFYTYYAGCNNLKSSPRRRKYVWNETTQKYTPIYTKAQLVGMIAEIDEYVAKNGKFNEWGIYTEDYYNSLKGYLADLERSWESARELCNAKAEQHEHLESEAALND